MNIRTGDRKVYGWGQCFRSDDSKEEQRGMRSMQPLHHVLLIVSPRLEQRTNRVIRHLSPDRDGTIIQCTHPSIDWIPLNISLDLQINQVACGLNHTLLLSSSSNAPSLSSYHTPAPTTTTLPSTPTHHLNYTRVHSCSTCLTLVQRAAHQTCLC